MLRQLRNDVFSVAPGPLPIALAMRVTAVVGVPLVAGTLAGERAPAVITAVGAMLTTLADVGNARPARLLTMAVAAVLLAAGGAIGAFYGRDTFADEALVLAAAFVAGWVHSSHPGVEIVARYLALATAAGAGLGVHNPRALVALGAGALLAMIAAALSSTAARPAPAGLWRDALHRAWIGSSAGPRFALCYALAAATAMFAAGSLGIARPFWATITVLSVMRPEGATSARMARQYLVGALAGVALVELPIRFIGAPFALAVLATLLAELARLSMARNLALGFALTTAYFLTALDLAQLDTGGDAGLAGQRLYDVGIGCAIAATGTFLATLKPRSDASA